MIDANHWNLRGPVRSMRSEIAERDLTRSDWETGRFFNFVVFDRNGRVLQLDQRGADDSVFRQNFDYDAGGRLLECRSGTAGGPVTHVRSCRYDAHGRLVEVADRPTDGAETTHERYTYDQTGRRTKVQTVDARFRTGNVGFGVDGSEFSYGAPGAATITTTYDEHGRSSEILFRDEADHVVLRVVFTRDGAGRVLTEEAFQNPGALVPPQADASPQDREMMLALLAQVYGSIRTTNAYDADGRLVRRTQSMGTLGGDVTTFTYNEHGDVAAESHVSTKREVHFDAAGQPEAAPDVSHAHDTSFSYEYDAHGNWTSRVVSARVATDLFAPRTIERRTIEYYGQT